LPIKNLERLQQIHRLIDTEKTGSPSELARKLNVSERLIYNLIEQLKDYEAAICYDRRRKTYYYREEFQLKIKISVKVISGNVVTKILGNSFY